MAVRPLPTSSGKVFRMSKSLVALIAAPVLAVLPVQAAYAAPTAQCLWAALSPADRGGFAELVQNNAPMSADLHAVLAADVRGCGFEAGINGERRGGFLIAMTIYRMQAETALSVSSHVAAAQLNQAWAGLDPAFHAQLLTFARERYFRRPGAAPDPAGVNALMTQLHLSGDGPRQQLQNWLLIRATTEYIETVGADFQPPPPAAPPAPPPPATAR